jgi:uncharacterized membrane protein
MNHEEVQNKDSFLRYHLPGLHLNSVFGDDWFGLRAESLARFFGTPGFLLAQTTIVAIWILINILGYAKFDLYPFIFLNLVFSLQAAYAAPIILLAQTRQADRDKTHSQADAQHREAIARASVERERLAAIQTAFLIDLLNKNTLLTEETQRLSKRIDTLTSELHVKIMNGK